MLKKKQPRKTKSLALRIVAAIVVCIVVIWVVKPRAMLNSLPSFSPIYLIPLLAVYFLFVAVGACNLWIFVKVQTKLPVPAVPFLYRFYISSSVGAFTPGQIGELAIVPMLATMRISRKATMVAVLLDKLVTLVSFGSLAIIAMVHFFPSLATKSIVTVALIAVGAVTVWIGGLVFLPKRTEIVAFNIWLVKILDFVNTLIRFAIVHPYAFAANVALTQIRCLLSAATVYVGLLAFGVNPERFISLYLLMSIARISTYLPFTINGLGVLEGSAAIVLSAIGIPMAITVNSLVLNRVVHYTISSVGLLAGLLLRRTDAHRALARNS